MKKKPTKKEEKAVLEYAIYLQSLTKEKRKEEILSMLREEEINKKFKTS
jgi:hypothetical protein